MSSSPSLIFRTLRRHAASMRAGPGGAARLWRHKSSQASQPTMDPGQFVERVTAEDIEKDPELADFYRANFPEYFGIDVIAEKNDTDLTEEELREFGFTDEDIELMKQQEKKSRTNKVDPYNVITRKPDKGLGTPEQQALNIRIMKAYRRTVEGTGPCHRLRLQGLIPGMIRGGDPKRGLVRRMIRTPWSEIMRETVRQKSGFEARVYDLTVYEDEEATDGETYRVIPQDVQWHPFKYQVYSVDFRPYRPGVPLKIPIVYINEDESPALKRTGFIVPVNKFVECVIEEGVPVPEKLELECTGIKLKDVIRLDRIEFPEGVTISKNVDPKTFIIGPVFGGRSATALDDAEDDA